MPFKVFKLFTINFNIFNPFIITRVLHIARGLYYSSYKSPRILVWTIGVIILVLMMAIAFLGSYMSLKWCYTIFPISHEWPTPYLSTFSILPFTRSPRCDKYLNVLKLQPKAVFEDLHIEGAKASICRLIKPLGGVYLILNLINGKTYIGSAIKGRMPNRLHKHLYALCGNKPVAAAVNKYGLENFAFVVVDLLPTVVELKSNKDLLTMEDYYLQLLLPEYNIAPRAGNTLGIKHTEATKLKMRVNYSSERRENIGRLNRGNKLTSETIERIREAALTRAPMSEETRKKVSANSAAANLYCVSKVDNTVFPDGACNITLRTMPTVAEYCNCSVKTVQRALRGTGVIKQIWRVTLIGKEAQQASPK
jgi:group I intron endonuclease